jgi:hypothetical protein
MKKQSFIKKRKPPQGLKKARAEYTPLALELTWNAKEVRQEYSRLRSIYRKRYERLTASKYSDIGLVKERPISRYKPIRQIESNYELYHLLSELASIVSSDLTVSGLKKREKEKIEHLNEVFGVGLKSHEDLLNFSKFMEQVRDFASDRIYDSDFAVELYSEGENLSNQKLIELYKEFLKTGSRNITKLKSRINKNDKAIRQKRKAAKRKRRRK